jgi:hypothetical protein
VLRNREAVKQYMAACTSGTLSADLLAFVERRLQQLSH